MAGEERSVSGNVKLQINKLRKVFNTRNGEMIALNGVDLDIRENEFICVVGPSGCGKSTLLNIIAGLSEPTSGEVYCDGKLVKGTGTERGVVFQQYALFPWLTVKKNVMFGLELKGIKGKEAEERAMKYIKMVQLEEFADHYPKELSGGMKQRVAIARALALEPKILFFDEPTSALDPRLTGEILALIRSLKDSRMAMVIVTHEMQFAREISDRILFLSEGEVLCVGSPEEVFSSGNERLKNFLGGYTRERI